MIIHLLKDALPEENSPHCGCNGLSKTGQFTASMSLNGTEQTITVGTSAGRHFLGIPPVSLPLLGELSRKIQLTRGIESHNLVPSSFLPAENRLANSNCGFRCVCWDVSFKRQSFCGFREVCGRLRGLCLRRRAQQRFVLRLLPLSYPAMLMYIQLLFWFLSIWIFLSIS